MGDIRLAVKAAVESLDMRPVMYETEPASADNSRRALLDRIHTCDALLLLIWSSAPTMANPASGE